MAEFGDRCGLVMPAEAPATSPRAEAQWQMPETQQARAYELVLQRAFGKPGRDIELMFDRWSPASRKRRPCMRLGYPACHSFCRSIVRGGCVLAVLLAFLIGAVVN